MIGVNILREKTHENMINLLETAMKNFGTDHE